MKEAVLRNRVRVVDDDESCRGAEPDKLVQSCSEVTSTLRVPIKAV